MIFSNNSYSFTLTNTIEMYKLYFTAGFVLMIMFVLSCNKPDDLEPNTTFEPTDVPVPIQAKTGSYTPFSDLGDTLYSNYVSYDYDTITVMIDASINLSFKIEAKGHSDNYFLASYIGIITEDQDSIRFLLLPSMSTLATTFQPGDSIATSIANNSNHIWYDYTPYNALGAIKNFYIEPWEIPEEEELPIGENYLVFKFGDPSNERLGWVNVVYQDSLLYVKEGFFESNINTDIVVGEQ